MAVKVYVLLVALVFAGAVAPLAHAQLLGLGSSGGVGGILGGILGFANIVGNVRCSVGGSLTSNPFPNAAVQLKCGGNTVATTTTNSNGDFQIIAGLLSNIMSVLDGCNVAVTTPLSSCNVSLPSAGTLVAPLSELFPGSNDLISGLFTLIG